MNNEPVAWMLIRNESCVEVTEWYGVMRGWEEFLGDNEKIVELYTHPVKELTGGYEVMDMSEYDVTVRMPISDWEEILRKAQERCNGFCGEYECKENQSVCKRKAQENV